MGQDKRFLLFEEKFWLDHTIKLLHHTLGERSQVFVSGDSEGEDYYGIPDLIPAQGPLMGLYSVIKSKGFKDSKSNWILIIPVDMPKMNRASLEQLLPYTQDENQNIEIIKFENEQLPIMIRNNDELVKKLSVLLEDTNSFRSLKQLIKRSKVRNVEKKTTAEFVNFNQPSDLEQL
jgi:molybdopterin-guanine dinucleotide biosynthesis protein A